jgi:hypothetical protein
MTRRHPNHQEGPVALRYSETLAFFRCSTKRARKSRSSSGLIFRERSSAALNARLNTSQPILRVSFISLSFDSASLLASNFSTGNTWKNLCIRKILCWLMSSNNSLKPGSEMSLATVSTSLLLQRPQGQLIDFFCDLFERTIASVIGHFDRDNRVLQ